MKKKKALYIAALVIGLSIVSGSTLAYFTSDDIAHNVITTKEVQIDVLSLKEENGSMKDDENAAIKIMPGTTVSKVVAAQSLETEAWVRMCYDLTIFDSNGSEMSVSEEEMKKMIIIEPNDTAWKFDDGWWYYKSAIKAGEKTSPLFSEIGFSGPDMGNEYQNGTIELDIIAQAVQKANNGGSVMEAAGWPD